MPKVICEWGSAGIDAWKASASVFIIVDVLSFSTAVSVSVERGATVIPFAYGDEAAAAAEAARRGAILAKPRTAGGGQFSLSPVSLKRLAPGSRLLLPSPNGSRLSVATDGVATICGCLRNARAVAETASGIAGNGMIAVIPAGERWPDQTLRPAIEDWLGAGAIIEALAGESNAEAELAADAFKAVNTRLANVVRDSMSGRELSEKGYEEDVDVALEIGTSAVVPIMREGIYEIA